MVMFGRQRKCGLIVGLQSHSHIDSQRLRRVLKVIDREPVMDGTQLELLQWASGYYQHPIGEVISSALPKRLRDGHDASLRGQQRWRLTTEGYATLPNELSRAPRQSAIFAWLKQHQQGCDAAQLNMEFNNWRRAMDTLVSKGLVSIHETTCLPVHSSSPTTSPALNQHQQIAVDAICSRLRQYSSFVLQGVTGSGKTEVYLQVIEQVLTQNRQALVLVPEIGLTPQLVQRFQQRFAVPLAVLHSGMTDSDRHCAWNMARSGDAPIIIGTRSAVFTPMARPGLIVVDEEHDVSFKQQDGFRYHARDLAVYRAHQHNIPIVLGSATPCLETLHNIEQRRYQALQLPERAGTSRAPSLQVIDMRHQRMCEGIAEGLIQIIKQHLDADGQVLLFLNRRGYAPTLLCHECGWTASCKRCDGHLTYHAAINRLRCHHCGAEQPKPAQCPECSSEQLLAVGEGTERIESMLRENFKDVPIVRIDRDTTRRKGSLEAQLDAIQRGEHRILIGTQMLSKGHHFPGVTLVGILNVDQGLFSTDFRAMERMAQMIIQVSGRAGRADKPGSVVLQTHQPEHPWLNLLLTGGYAALCKALLAERRAAGLPPYSHLGLLRAESPSKDTPMRFLQQAATLLRPQLEQGTQLWGPIPAPMEKRAGRYRAQLLLASARRAQLKKLLDIVRPQLGELSDARKARWSLDIDPVDLY